jgi:uncharacterized coiled-coil protein SlyX
MSESTHDNTKTSDLTTADKTLIQTNLNTEATELQSSQSESFLNRDEIQMTLKEFNQKLRDNDRSIKRIEENMAALYDKLERTPEIEESKVSSKKKSKKKKEKKLDKKGKKGKKKGKKLDKKGKKRSRKIKSGKKIKSASAITSPEKSNNRPTKSKVKKGRTKNASKKK